MNLSRPNLFLRELLYQTPFTFELTDSAILLFLEEPKTYRICGYLKEGDTKEEMYNLYLNHLKEFLLDDGFDSEIMQFLCKKNVEPVWLTSETCKDYGFSSPGLFIPFEPWLSKPNGYGQIRNVKDKAFIPQNENQKFIKYLNPKGGNYTSHVFRYKTLHCR